MIAKRRKSKPAAGAPLAVITTVASRAEARALAQTLVERNLAACIHLWPIQSVYRWQGRVRSAHEYRLVCKSVAGRYAALEAAIKALHSYDLPAIYAVPLARMHAPYARWIEEQCREPRAARASTRA